MVHVSFTRGKKFLVVASAKSARFVDGVSWKFYSFFDVGTFSLMYFITNCHLWKVFWCIIQGVKRDGASKESWKLTSCCLARIFFAFFTFWNFKDIYWVYRIFKKNITTEKSVKGKISLLFVRYLDSKKKISSQASFIKKKKGSKLPYQKSFSLVLPFKRRTEFNEHLGETPLNERRKSNAVWWGRKVFH